jgi:undecaprenyl-diphosphatase
VNFRLFEALNQWAGRIDLLDDVMEFSAVWLIYLVFGVVAVLVARGLLRQRARPVLNVAASAALAFALAAVLSHIAPGQRPFQNHQVHQLIPHAAGASLPRDHATAAFTLALAVGVFLHRRWGLVLTVAALTIGVSRVWVGVHYPVDIAVGTVIAALAVTQVSIASRWYEVLQHEGETP